MNPAFSVIFFTTLSGMGYGLWGWLGLALASGDWLPISPMPAITLLVLGLLLVSVGLLSSLLHLGKPGRAWRALSQWRSSWLSREGVLALACFLPALLLLGLLLALKQGAAITPAVAIAGGILALLSLATVCATAMIYASLRTIPAWHDPRVLPVYLLYAVSTGGLLFRAGLAGFGQPAPATLTALLAASLLALAAVKWSYWRRLDQPPALPSRASAVGLPAGSVVNAFERPHTGQNFITREMGFVLARKHARVLRQLAMALTVVMPLAIVLLTLGWAVSGGWLIAALACGLGAVLERWLFFAEAQHVVMRYYP